MGCALQLAHSYAPDLDILGGAVGAAPANLNAEYKYLNGGRLAFLIMYTALGMNSAYPAAAAVLLPERGGPVVRRPDA